jgi:hypothetical protein
LVNTRAGGDSPFLLQRVYEMSVALQGGHFPVRWMPDAAFGFGYPFWNYYAPLAFYVAAMFHLAGLSIVNAIKLTQILGFLGAGAGMYLMADDIFDSRPAALLAAAAYTYAPFHLVNVYVRGDSLGEFVAFAFYPLVFLGLRRLRARPGPGPAAFTAIAYAGLILSHNISALIFTPFALAYVLFLLFTNHRTEHQTEESHHAVRSTQYAMGSRGGYLLWTAAIFALGLTLSAFYWAPALLEQDAVQLQGNLTGYFHYAGHFRSANLVQRELLFDFDVDAAGTPFAMGLIQAILGLAGFLIIIALSVSRNSQRATRNAQLTIHNSQLTIHNSYFFAGIAVVSTFLITPWSRPLWDHLPLLPFVQFPWRWLSVQAFGLSVVIGGLAGFLNRNRFRTGRHHYTIPWILAISLILLIILTSMLHLQVQYLPIRDTDVTPERLMLYEMFTGNIGSTVRAEYLPAAVNPRPWTSARLVEGMPAHPLGATSAELLRSGPAWQQWQITVDQPRDVVFPTYWFPGWHAAVDGRPAETSAQPNHGGIRVTVPAGTHHVNLALGRTPVRRLAELASAFGVLLLLTLLVRRGLSMPDLRAAAAMAGVIVAAGLVLVATSALAGPVNGPLTMDFSRMPYLHPNPGGVRLASGFRLLSYHLSTTDLKAGDILAIDTAWSTDAPLRPGPHAPTLEVALVSPAEVLFGVPTAVSKVRFSPEGNTTLRLRVPDDVTAGIYLLRLRIVNNSEKLATRTPNGAYNGVLYLQPVRVRPRIVTREQIAGRFAKVAGLEAPSVRQTSPERLEVSVTWWAEQPIPANYATSIRLKDAAGEVVAQADTQPCYGFCPTSLWEPGVPVYDRRWLDLPAGTPPGKDYQIEIVLYEAASLAPVGTVRFNKITLSDISVKRDVVPRFVFPAGLAVADFAVGRGSAEPGEDIPVRVTWFLQKPLDRDIQARLLLLDEAGEQIVHAEPARALAGVPTSRWPLGAYVTQSYRVTLPRDLLPGRYQMAVGLDDSDGWFAPSITLQITPSTRTFEPPALPQTLGVDFGGQIRLLGYDLKQDANGLSLRVAWQALVDDSEHRYKTFVHLFDPTTEQIVAQRDTEPRGGERPTSTWIAGEVVTDSFQISTADVPAGTYRLAVGLYDPTTGQRLPAVGPDGGRLPQDRVVLEEVVTVER